MRDPHAEALDQVPRGPCSAWPKTAAAAQGKAGYSAALDVLIKATHPDAPAEKQQVHLEELTSSMIAVYLGTPPATDYQKGFLEALLWFWNHVLERADDTVTVAAKSLLYPEPVMGY